MMQERSGPPPPDFGGTADSEEPTRTHTAMSRAVRHEFERLIPRLVREIRAGVVEAFAEQMSEQETKIRQLRFDLERSRITESKRP